MTLYTENRYEAIAFPDCPRPFLFHYDVRRAGDAFAPHWQDSLEILYFTEGESEVLSDAHRVRCAL